MRVSLKTSTTNRNITEVFLQILLGLVFSVLLGMINLFVGAIIGGNFGFPPFGGNSGYEAGGVFFGILGLSLGCLIGMIIVDIIFHRKRKYTSALIAAALVAVINLVLFDRELSLFMAVIILLLPLLVLIIMMNWQKITGK